MQCLLTGDSDESDLGNLPLCRLKNPALRGHPFHKENEHVR